MLLRQIFDSYGGDPQSEYTVKAAAHIPVHPVKAELIAGLGKGGQGAPPPRSPFRPTRATWSCAGPIWSRQGTKGSGRARVVERIPRSAR